MRYVIGFAGSPRVGGNSDLLLDQWLEGAEAAGAKVEKIYLDQLNIEPCTACDACRQDGSGVCNVMDDMQSIYTKLLAADTWVLATPIYWWGPSAQLKLMVDRWYGLMKNHRVSLQGKRGALVIAMGDDEARTAQPTIDMFGMAFEYLKMQMLEPLVVTAHEKGEVAKDREALKKAYAFGTKYGA